MGARCDACQLGPREGRAKKVGAVVGLLLFCPCHLPVTIAGFVMLVAALGVPAGAAWLRPALYGVFGTAFLVFLVLLVRMAARLRAFGREHEGHGVVVAVPPQPSHEAPAKRTVPAEA